MDFNLIGAQIMEGVFILFGNSTLQKVSIAKNFEDDRYRVIDVKWGGPLGINPDTIDSIVNSCQWETSYSIDLPRYTEIDGKLVDLFWVLIDDPPTNKNRSSYLRQRYIEIATSYGIPIIWDAPLSTQIQLLLQVPKHYDKCSVLNLFNLTREIIEEHDISNYLPTVDKDTQFIIEDDKVIACGEDVVEILNIDFIPFFQQVGDGPTRKTYKVLTTNPFLTDICFAVLSKDKNRDGHVKAMQFFSEMIARNGMQQKIRAISAAGVMVSAKSDEERESIGIIIEKYNKNKQLVKLPSVVLPTGEYTVGPYLRFSIEGVEIPETLLHNFDKLGAIKKLAFKTFFTIEYYLNCVGLEMKEVTLDLDRDGEVILSEIGFSCMGIKIAGDDPENEFDDETQKMFVSLASLTEYFRSNPFKKEVEREVPPCQQAISRLLTDKRLRLPADYKKFLLC